MDGTEHEEFTKVYVGHYADVLGYLLRRLPADDARDAAAEVFAVVWRRLDELPAGDATLPWLYRTAAYVVANQRRTQRRRHNLRVKVVATRAVSLVAADGDPPSGLIDPTGGNGGRSLVVDSLGEPLASALDELSDNDREILLLNAWEGLPASQLALHFDISLKAAERRLSRAKVRLARALDRLSPSPIPDPAFNGSDATDRRTP